MVQQVLGNAALLEHRSHEDEQRNGDEHRILNSPSVDARQEVRELGMAEDATHDAEETEENACRAENEGHGITDEHYHG